MVDGDALVVVELKSALKVDDVNKFNQGPGDLINTEAIAAGAIDESADRYAYCQGLFVLTMGREGLVTLRNDDAFRPRDFADSP